MGDRSPALQNRSTMTSRELEPGSQQLAARIPTRALFLGKILRPQFQVVCNHELGDTQTCNVDPLALLRQVACQHLYNDRTWAAVFHKTSNPSSPMHEYVASGFDSLVADPVWERWLYWRTIAKVSRTAYENASGPKKGKLSHVGSIGTASSFRACKDSNAT